MIKPKVTDNDLDHMLQWLCGIEFTEYPKITRPSNTIDIIQAIKADRKEFKHILTQCRTYIVSGGDAVALVAMIDRILNEY